jgi:hypothetical protein
MVGSRRASIVFPGVSIVVLLEAGRVRRLTDAPESGLYASLVLGQTCAIAAGWDQGADDRPRLQGKRGPPIQGSPLLREPDEENSVREEGGRPDPRTQAPAFHRRQAVRWADHRPAVCAEILTKSAGLSSKITFGEGMASMGDICPTAAIPLRRFVLRVGLSVTPRRKREGIADFWTLRPPLSPA